MSGRSKVNVAVLISGRGSNLQALIDACQDVAFPARIVLVLSNKADAAGLQRAEQVGIPTKVIAHKDFADRAAFDAAMDGALRAAGVDIICLAGFMRVLTAAFVKAWPEKILNIHPSLLPAFKGLHTHEQALAAGVKFSGCSVHFVTPDLDDGPIIAQAVVPVQANDDAVRLAARVLTFEHRLYPAALRLVAEGRVHVVDGVASVEEGEEAQDGMLNPLIH